MALRRKVGLPLAAALFAGCSLATPLPPASTVDGRLDLFPTSGLPLSAPVTVSWNEHQIPYVDAATDADLAFTLGLVHAHLRLGQMEILRRVSQGRLSEMGGPLAVDIDHSLRILGLGRAAPDIIAAMPEETRAWTQSFVDGVNYYVATEAPLPHEFAVLGLEREPWTIQDVITIGRLASVDVNWLAWFSLLGKRDRADWPELWAQVRDQGSLSTPSFGPGAPTDQARLGDILGGTSRSGSNSVAVAGWRSATGGALMANDPHLGVSLPNLWLIAGYRSPSFNVVGLMIPGLPFVAIGRNPEIAWGGTNLRAASSDLFDVAELPAADIVERRETIPVRWWFDETVTIRETQLGPVITDAPVFDTSAQAALRWIGHDATDEMTAMLAVNRATDWEAFRNAMDGFAISAQNFLYADRQGNIGQVMATHLPSRSPEPPPDMIQPRDRAAAWDRIVTSLDLPASYNPESGYLGSANNRGAQAEVPIGYFFSPNDRIERIAALLNGDKAVTVDDLAALQRDVYMASSVAIRDALIDRLDRLAPPLALSDAQSRVLDLIRRWDGHYREDSAGALAFELVLFQVSQQIFTPEILSAYDAGGRPLTLMRDDILAAPDTALRDPLSTALSAAVEPLRTYRVWGEMHRLELAHPLANLPVIGGRYRFADVPVAGSTSTLMKTAHDLTDTRHSTRYGSQARHISDLSSPDANYFVLLGGQDGWINSSTFLDHVPLWREGRYIQVPLRAETAHSTFSRQMILTP
ncbi:MAG: penicillin acylase family protein [Inquilinaceae bacterium]